MNNKYKLPSNVSDILPKVCLNMIVRNESGIITRLLESVLPFIDSYCICDTGSTDNTIQIIRDFFILNSQIMTGKILTEPFRDFEYNRTFAFHACNDMDIDYVLLLDADMILYVNPDITPLQFKLKLLNMDADMIYIFQGSSDFNYKNIRIVKNRKDITYWGVTHEYVNCPDNAIYKEFSIDDLFINDIGDGGCKSDKFIRDIHLLKIGLEKYPNNDRYTFYLANSYRNSQLYEDAINTYKTRIELGGWYEEVWYSYYSIGNCYKYMEDMPNAIYWWCEAYHYFSNRIENLYEIVKYYRITGKHKLAYHFYTIAKNELIKNRKNEYLFLQKDVYDYKLLYELTIFGYYYNPDNYNLSQYSMDIITNDNIESSIYNNILSNYKFYSPFIKDFENLSIFSKTFCKNIELLNSLHNNHLTENISILTDDFVSSTPSICFINKNTKLIVNIRYVNYKINNGIYDIKQTIHTINRMIVLDTSSEEWIILNDFILDYDKSLDNLYVGIEDIRLFSKNVGTFETLYFNGNRVLHTENIMIEHGIIDFVDNKMTSNLIEKINQNIIEKNWVLIDNDTMIYCWYPLTIGNNIANKSDVEVENKTSSYNSFVQTHEIQTPYFFKDVRGSSNGVLIHDELWFICHTVSYEDTRYYYYHIFVVLDSQTYNVKKYSRYFTFEKIAIEYTLGFIHIKKTETNPSAFIIGYSTMDNTTKYMAIETSCVDKMMISLM